MQEIFDKIEEVHKHLDREGKFHLLPYRLDDLRDAIIAQSMVDDIEFIEVPSEKLSNDMRIQGKVELYQRSSGVYALPETVALVYYMDGLDALQKRFVVCKEMSHLLIHDGRVCTSEELIELVNALVLPFHLREFVSRMAHQPQFATEIFAELFGLELLCPFQFRDRFFADIKDKKISIDEIAGIFGVPSKRLGQILSPEFHELQRSLRRRRL